MHMDATYCTPLLISGGPGPGPGHGDGPALPFHPAEQGFRAHLPARSATRSLGCATPAATEVTTTTQPPPTVRVTRGRRPTAKQTPKPTAGKRQSSRLAAKNNGMFVDMTDKAVQRRALQDSLASCSQAVQQHVTR
jgi:hypothetical protein